MEDHSVNSRKIAELNKLVRELETERRDLEVSMVFTPYSFNFHSSLILTSF